MQRISVIYRDEVTGNNSQRIASNKRLSDTRTNIIATSSSTIHASLPSTAINCLYSTLSMSHFIPQQIDLQDGIQRR